MADQATSALLTLTAQIVTAHVAANTVPAADVPALINAVYGALIYADAPKVQPQEPAVPIKRSIQRDYLVCLEDGAKLQSMKRYLRAQFGLTPDAYRAKWGLPRDYPMVAPAYAAKRSKLAKQLGLGTACAPQNSLHPKCRNCLSRPRNRRCLLQRPSTRLPAFRRPNVRVAGHVTGDPRPAERDLNRANA